MLNETVALAISDFSNHIKSIKLQPACKVTAVNVVGKQFLGLVEEQLGSVVHKGFVLHQCGHAKCRVYGSSERGVEIIVGCAEEGGEAVSLDHRLLNNVKVRLLSRISPWFFSHKSVSPYLDEALVKSVDGLQGLWVGKGERVWTETHDISILGVELLVCNLRSLFIHIPNPPEISYRSQERSWVFV